jgi:hypothetical protein
MLISGVTVVHVPKYNFFICYHLNNAPVVYSETIPGNVGGMTSSKGSAIGQSSSKNTVAVQNGGISTNLLSYPTKNPPPGLQLTAILVSPTTPGTVAWEQILFDCKFRSNCYSSHVSLTFVPIFSLAFKSL